MTLAHKWPSRLSPEARCRVQRALEVGCNGYGCERSPAASLVRRVIAGGAVQVLLQCSTCGKALGGAHKRDQHPDWADYPLWDADLRAAFDYTLTDRFREDQEARFAVLAVRSTEWFQHYDAYLDTPLWRARRQRVLQRAKWLCEGCGDREATQAHHLRYPRDCVPGSPEWTAQEKLFDLVAVCDRCHRDVHP